jgi:hypothetical protein
MKNFVRSCLFASFVKISSLLKISYIAGSHVLCLSAASVLAPLSGAFGGVSGSFGVFFARLVLHFLLCKTIALSFLALCVPGLFACLYWATRNSIVRVGVPLLCMILFIAHPVGRQAFIYSIYWLVPVIISIRGYNSLFFQALGSTFVAHAVGSVIWLYTVPMTAAQWMGLMPVVAIERLLFACAMVGVYRVVTAMRSFAQSSKNKSLSLSQSF